MNYHTMITLSYFGPDFKLHIRPSNMTNQNTPEYMEKIKQRLFENLRMLPHAPGVQMQAMRLSDARIEMRLSGSSPSSSPLSS